MSGAYSQVDATGAYLANVILKNGRNEVQIYPIAQHPGPLVVENLIKRFELDIDQNVVCSTWFSESSVTETPRKGKRRASEAESHVSNGSLNGNGHINGHTSTSLFAVALANGTVLVFSPNKDDAAYTITCIDSCVSLTRSTTSGHFWALSNSQVVSEVDVSSNTLVKLFKLGKTDAEVGKIWQTDFVVKKLGASALLVASSKVHLVDGTKSKKQVIGELAQEDNDESSLLPFAYMLPVSGSVVSLVRELSSTLILHDISKPENEPVTFESKCGTITRVEFLKNDTGVIFGDNGAEVVKVSNGITSCAIVKTNQPTIFFENIFFAAQNGVIGVWYDGNQPRFVKLSDDIHFLGNYSIPIDYKSKTSDLDISTPEITFVASESTSINNIAPAELFSELSDLLLEETVSKKSVIKLCSSNDIEDNIKDTIRLFSQASECSVLVKNLFLIISHKVASETSKKSSLSMWLKWLLLAHGGYISKQEELASELKNLQSSLDNGMKMMPKLLALQGRLQLLKSQAELRERIRNQTMEEVEEESAEEAEHDTFNDTFNNTTNIEELIVYMNGENDDDFDSVSADINGTVE